MKVHMMAQGSGEWWEARRGVPTASAFDRILTPGGKPSAQQDDLVAELIADIHCLTPNYFTERGAPSRAMQHGTDTEPEARRAFVLDTGLRPEQVRQVGFCVSDCGRFGCSPDFLVTADAQHCCASGGYAAAGELKCPMMKTQVKYLLAGKELPPEYRPQVHGHLIVTGLPAVHFYSYSIGLPAVHVLVGRTEYTSRLADELERFWEKFEAAKRKVGAA